MRLLAVWLDSICAVSAVYDDELVAVGARASGCEYCGRGYRFIRGAGSRGNGEREEHRDGRGANGYHGGWGPLPDCFAGDWGVRSFGEQERLSGGDQERNPARRGTGSDCGSEATGQ